MTGDAALQAAAAAALDVGAHALRIVPVAALSPFLGGPAVPPLARLGLALCLGAAVRASGGPGLPAGASLLGIAATELALGAVLAVAASLPVEAARGAGRLVDTLRGATLAELHVAPLRQRETAVGDLLAWWTVALGAWAGADRLLVAALLDTYRAVPVGNPTPGAVVIGAQLESATAIVSAGICLGAPAAGALLCADLALAAASRVAPRAALGDAAHPLRAALGIAAVAAPAAAIGGRLVELVALSASAVARGAGSLP
ncbi:MAG TPA: flagellar biosynthetic protein FliR [Anaeromyxobacteraceae bacterium]|nr:flagellar biosynthetic protein FliR [Anaeromyxobacteraceae bacterium]